MTAGGEPEQIRVGLVPAEYFHALSVAPLAGRLFTEEENRWGSHHVAVVSASFWKERFGRVQRLEGQTVRINDEPYTVVGIVPDAIPARVTGTDPVSEFDAMGITAVATGQLQAAFSAQSQAIPSRRGEDAVRI